MEDSRFNPFPGLRPFDFGEQHLFFGREGQSEEILRHLRENRFLAVIGTSGSGKSSLIRAGLLPDLYGGFMAGAGSHWRFAIFRPMNDPIGNLARALNRTEVLQTEPPSGGDQTRSDMLLEVTLRRSGLGLVEATRLARLPANENLLVVVDQFEELFRFAAAANSASQADDAAAFVKLLLEASRQSAVPLYIVITMRSDFIGDCAKFPDLPEAVTAGMYLIPRMTREQRRRAVEEPVAVGGGAISLRLVNRLLNEVGDNPDQLPILQHALMRTWEHWVTRTLGARSFENDPIDFEDYEAIGGLQGALSNHADEAYNALPNDRRREIAKRMFQCLTEKGADNREVRRPTTIRSMAAVAHASTEEVIQVIDEFHKQGRSFLTTPASVPLTGDSVIDISHESLIRLWVRLKEWVNEESESARSYRRLADDAERYARGQVSLLRDPELQNALNWKRDEHPTAEWAERYHPNFAQAMKFLEESSEAREAEEAEKERQRTQELIRVRRHLYIVRGLSAIAIAFAIFAGISAYRAHIKAVAADTATVEAKRQKAVADQNAEDARRQKDTAEAAKEQAKTEAEHAVAEKKSADLAKAAAEHANRESQSLLATTQTMGKQINETNLKLEGTNKALETTNSDLKKEHDLHLASDEKFGNFLWDDMTRFNNLTEETSSRPDLRDILEHSAQKRIEVTNEILKTDPENRNALAINVITRDDIARIHRKQKSREDYLKTVEDNRTTAEAILSKSKGYFARTMGATLLASSADNFRLLGDKDKALKAAKRATEVADSVGPNADPKNSDWFYLNFLNLTYAIAGYVEKNYQLSERALDSYQKAVVPQVKSLHASPTDYSVTQVVETSESLAMAQKTLKRFDEAAKSYEQAISELNGYPGLAHKPLNAKLSGVLVRLHTERGDVFRENTKNFAAAEEEYTKAGAAADAIDRKSQDGQSQSVEADRTVGNALRNLSEDLEDPAAKKKLVELALRHHQRSLDLDLALLKDDPSASRYKDLTYAYFNIGYDKLHSNEYEETRKAYNARADAAAQAAKLDPSDESLRYLADCFDTVARFEEDESVWNIPNALKANSSRLKTLKRLVDRKDPEEKDKVSLSRTYGSRSWFDVLIGDFPSALTDSDAALQLDPKQLWIRANRGHAFLFLHRTAEAKQNYMEFIESSSQGSDYLKSVLNDFELFRQRRIPRADLKATDGMQSLLVSPGGKDLPPAYASALALIYAYRGNDVLEKKKDLTEAEADYTKAAAAADGIDRKSPEGQAAAVLADRAVGTAWHGLAQTVEDTETRKRFLDRAMQFHERSLNQDLALHQNNPGAEDYKSFSYGYQNLGSDHFLQHEYEDARKLYFSAAEAAVKAAKLAPSDEATRYSADCFQTIATFESSDEVQNVPNALGANQYRIDTLKPLVERNSPNSQDVNNLAQAYGNNSWFSLLLGNFSAALKDSETALKLDPTQLWILGNQAHALLFLHRIEDAKQVYLKYTKGDKDDARYQKSVFDDFAELRKRRPPNADLKLVDDMEDYLVTKGGYAKPSEKASNK